MDFDQAFDRLISNEGGYTPGVGDPGIPNCTTISNTITATVVFSLSAGGIVQAKTTAGTANRTLASFGVALMGG